MPSYNRFVRFAAPGVFERTRARVVGRIVEIAAAPGCLAEGSVCTPNCHASSTWPALAGRGLSSDLCVMDKRILAARAAQAWTAMSNPGGETSFVFLHEFIETVLSLDADTHPHTFAAQDVAAIEASWRYVGPEYCWAGGFLLRLRDGRRAYLATECAPAGTGRAADHSRSKCWRRTRPTTSVTPLQPTAWAHHTGV